MMQLLTESRAKSFRRCQREHLLRYEQGIVSTADRLALRMGTLVHHALEAWWREADVEHRLPAALSAIDANAGDMDLYELAKVDAMVRGYDARWAAEPLQAIAVEQQFSTPLINPETGGASKTFVLAGKLDVIALDTRLNRQVFIEHKTSSEDIGQGSVYWSCLKLDGQVSTYFRGAESLGYKPEACIYDVLGKPKLKPLMATPIEERKYTKAKTGEPSRLYSNQRDTDETPDEYGARCREAIAEDPDRYYQRGEVVRLEEEMHQYDLEMWQLSKSMLESRRLAIAPRNTDSCRRFGSLCSYQGVCCGEESIDDESKFKRLDWVHPELEAK